MFSKQRKKALTIKEMNDLLNYCYKYRYIINGPKPKGEPFKLYAYVEDKETLFSLSVKIGTKACTYVCRKDKDEVMFGATGMEAFSILSRYYKIKDFRDDEMCKKLLAYDDEENGSGSNKFLVSASPLMYKNEKYEGTRNKAIGYDLNSSYSNAMLKPIPDTSVPYHSGIVKAGEIGFKEDENGHLVPVFENHFSYFIFPLMDSPFTKFVNNWYKKKKNAKDPADKKKAKDVLNFCIGYMQKTNPFIRAKIIYEANKMISDLIDENTLYCNTDSIVSLTERKDIKLGNNIGQFKIEHQGDFAYIGFNYQWNRDVPSYRSIQKSAFKKGYDMLKDPLPARGSGNIVKYNENTYRLEKIK